MFHNCCIRKGFGLLELVLCIGLLMMVLPILWMVISFVTDSMMQMAVSVERDRTAYLIVMTIDRCMSTSRSVEVLPNLLIFSSPLVTCRVEMDQQQLHITINEQERIFSDYQKRFRMRSVIDEGSLPHVTLILSDAGKDIYTYGFYAYDMSYI